MDASSPFNNKNDESHEHHESMIGTKRRSSDLSTTSDTPRDAPHTDTTSYNDNSKSKSNILDGGSYHYHYHCLPIHGEHKRAVSCLSFAPSRTNLNLDKVVCASASADGSVRLWDISTHLNNNTNSNTNSNSSNDDDQDGDNGDEDGEGDDVDANSKNKSNNNNKSNLILPVATVSAHSRGINDLAWSPRTPNLIATASDDKTLRIWDVTRAPTSNSLANNNSNTVGQPSHGTGGTGADLAGGDAMPGDAISDALVEFKGHSNFCFSVNFNPQGNLLVSGSFDETVKVWDVRTGECVSTLPAHSDPVTGVDFNRDGTCIVSSSHDGLMRIWDVATGECLKTIYAEGNPPVTFVRYSPNGRYVLSGMLDGKLRLWNVMGSRETNVANAPMTNSSKDYLNIGLSSAQGRGGQCTKTYEGHVNSKYCIFSAFSVANPLKQSIVTGSEDGKIHVYDLQTRAMRQVLDGHTDACLAVATHDSKDIIASGGMSNDRTVKFWVPK